MIGNHIAELVSDYDLTKADEDSLGYVVLKLFHVFRI